MLYVRWSKIIYLPPYPVGSELCPVTPDRSHTVRVEGDVILDLLHRSKWSLVSPHRIEGTIPARRLVPDVQPKERSSFPYFSSIIPRRRSDSLRGAAGLRKDQTENIGRVSQHSRRLQRFDALLSRRQSARGLKRFICCDLKIVRPLRGLFYVHCPAHVGAWISTESHPAAVPGSYIG